MTAYTAHFFVLAVVICFIVECISYIVTTTAQSTIDRSTTFDQIDKLLCDSHS